MKLSDTPGLVTAIVPNWMTWGHRLDKYPASERQIVSESELQIAHSSVLPSHGHFNYMSHSLSQFGHLRDSHDLGLDLSLGSSPRSVKQRQETQVLRLNTVQLLEV